MKGITPSTLDRIRLIRENLESGNLDLQRPSHLSWLCEQLREVSYDLHEELLMRGDEVRAIKVFEEFYLQFDRMAKFFSMVEEASE